MNKINWVFPYENAMTEAWIGIIWNILSVFCVLSKIHFLQIFIVNSLEFVQNLILEKPEYNCIFAYLM